MSRRPGSRSVAEGRRRVQTPENSCPRGFPNAVTPVTFRGGEGGGGISSGTTIIAAAAVLALVGAAVVGVLASRRKPRTHREDRLVQAVDEMRTRMDDLG